MHYKVTTCGKRCGKNTSITFAIPARSAVHYQPQKKGYDNMAIELKTIEHLCELSKLDYDEDGMKKVMGEMSDIIDLMDEIKSFDLIYDDTKDGNEIAFKDTREDVAEESFPTEKLLSNAENTDNCYVVPKVVE